MTVYFYDYEKVARKAKITPEQLEKLSHIIREEFPYDDMMFELHMVRACNAILEGRITIEEALKRNASDRR